MSAAPKVADALHRHARKLGCQLTELGNAERLAISHGHRLRYVKAWGAWLAWDERRWCRDGIGAEVTAAKDVVRELFAEASEASRAAAQAPANDDGSTSDEQLRKGGRAEALLKWARISSKASAIRGMLSLAESEPPIAAAANEFDQDRYLLNVLNGTIELRTGKLRPHRQADMITKLAPVEYDVSAECPRWQKFLERFQPDAEVRAWLQRFVGYCLTGSVAEQMLMFAHGTGANGKSTLLEVLLAILGDYARAGAADLLLAKHGESHPTEVADLEGARLVVVQEIDEGRRWAVATIKRLTGGDTIKARHMRQDFYSFAPTHKFAISANTKPEMSEQSHAIWRRMRLVPFGVTIPTEERDKHFVAKLLDEERPGILAWAVRGCLEWQQHGLGEPAAITKATDEYKTDQDVLGKWIDERCVVLPAIRTPTKTLFEDFRLWCKSTGRQEWKLDTLKRRLVERPGISDHRDKHARGLEGIGLRSDREDLSHRERVTR